MDELYLEQCCVQKYYQQRELLTWDYQVKKEEELEVFRPGRIGKLQKLLWDLFEKPHTSVGARVSSTIPRFIRLLYRVWKQDLQFLKFRAIFSTVQSFVVTDNLSFI